MKVLSFAFLLVVVGSAAKTVEAGLIWFTDQPSSNSVNWTNSVVGAGGTINANVNFETHTAGALQTGFYSASDGVTFSDHFNFDEVRWAFGPGQAGIADALPGEGTHPRSNYLHVSGAGAFTISFATPVLGVGLFTIDKFNESQLLFDVFSGQNATGDSLGSWLSMGQNFQTNKLFFVGVRTDDDTRIGSLRLTFDGNFGDQIGFDDLRFATKASAQPPPTAVTPEPASIALLGAGLLGLAGARLSRRRAARRRT